jgi:hypothetical protein
VSDYWFTPEIMPPTVSREPTLGGYLNCSGEDIPASDGGYRVRPGVDDALAKVILYAEKENRGRTHGYNPVRVIPSSLCGSVFLRKVFSGNIRQTVPYS